MYALQLYIIGLLIVSVGIIIFQFIFSLPIPLIGKGKFPNWKPLLIVLVYYTVVAWIITPLLVITCNTSRHGWAVLGCIFIPMMVIMFSIPAIIIFLWISRKWFMDKSKVKEKR